MHEDADERLQALIMRKAQQSQAARIRAKRAVIAEARASGSTWAEVANALGVPRASLLAALAPPRAPRAPINPPSTEAPTIRKAAQPAGITRWKATRPDT